MSERYFVYSTEFCERRHGFVSLKKDSQGDDSLTCRYKFGLICTYRNCQTICDLLDQESIGNRSNVLRLKEDCKTSQKLI